MKQVDTLFKNIERIVKYTFFSMALLCAFFVPASAEDADKQSIVRVGYVLHENYQEGKLGEIKSGYGYDYLQKLRSYTGWKYEYVYGSFAELLAGMENGTIDLMGNVSKTEARQAKMHFGKYEEGREDYVLLIPRKGTQISKFDLTTLEGKRIGVAKGTVQVELLHKWLSRLGYQYVTVVEFANYEARLQAFERGEIDAMLNTQGTERASWQELVKVGGTPYYFVTNKDKPWLKAALDKAQEQILVNNPDYNYNIKAMYSHFSKGDTYLTAQEQLWLDTMQKIRVGYVEAVGPFSYSDGNGVMHGVFRDVLDKMNERFGLRCTYQAYHNYMVMMEDFKQGKLDLILPVYAHQWFGEMQGMLLSDNVSSMDFVLVTLRGSKPSYANKLAVSKIGALQPFFVQAKHPYTQIVYKDNLLACIEAIKSGEVDGSYMSSTYINSLISNDISLRNLQVSDVNEPAGLAIGVREDLPVLLGIINKALAGIPQSDITDSIIRNTRENADENPYYTFMRRYKEVFIVLLVCLIVILGIVLYAYFDSQKKKKLLEQQHVKLEKAFHNYRKAMQQYEEADYDRRRDFLTGLYNRQDLFEMLKKVVAGELPPIQAMYMLDIDDYKSYNDHYGHVAGDNVLKIVGQAFLNYAQINDMKAFRYGGEEMLLVGFDAEQEAGLAAKDLVELVRALNIQRDDVASKRITVSLGYTTNNKRFEKMVDLADTAMYEAKAQGKDRAVKK